MVSFKNVAIVGVGLIGGSLALAARKAGIFETITGIDADSEALIKAESLGVIGRGTTDLPAGVRDADLVIVATPVRTIVPLVKNIAAHIREGTIITDVGSVKAEIIEAVESTSFGNIDFVPGHPIAGTENSGVEAAFADLFAGKKCVLTPTERTSGSAVESISQVWKSAGADVLLMDAHLHDRIFGAVSHLPHYVAFALVSCIDSMAATEQNLFSFSGGGLKDFTRIAASDPVMWTDIAFMNRQNIVEFIDLYTESLNRIRTLIDTGDTAGLHAELTNIRAIRRTRIR